MKRTEDMITVFEMAEAVKKARPTAPIIIHGEHFGRKGKCPYCSVVSTQLLDSNYCFNCGQRLK